LSRCQAEERPLVGARSASSVARVAMASTSLAQCRLLVATAASCATRLPPRARSPHRRGAVPCEIDLSRVPKAQLRMERATQSRLRPRRHAIRLTNRSTLNRARPGLGLTREACAELRVTRVRVRAWRYLAFALQSCVVIRAWTRPLAGGPPQTAMVSSTSCCSASRAICASGLSRSPWSAGCGDFRRRYLWRSRRACGCMGC
jgi:hypothetical protein